MVLLIYKNIFLIFPLKTPLCYGHLFLRKYWTVREVKISALFTVSFRITKTTLIRCLAKTGQDQHLKLSPQCHILFYKVIFDKKHSKPTQVNIFGSNSLIPPGINIFFWSSLFKLWHRKLPPTPQKGGSWECDINVKDYLYISNKYTVSIAIKKGFPFRISMYWDWFSSFSSR